MQIPEIRYENIQKPGKLPTCFHQKCKTN